MFGEPRTGGIAMDAATDFGGCGEFKWAASQFLGARVLFGEPRTEGGIAMDAATDFGGWGEFKRAASQFQGARGVV